MCFVCDLLCDVVWSVVVRFVALCVCVAVFPMRVNVLSAMYCVICCSLCRCVRLLC